jgi:N-acetylmuramoyl-L-alanine amidase
MENMSMPTSSTSTDAPRASRIVQAALSISILLATLFTAFSPRLLSGDFGETILALMTPQAVSNPSNQTGRQAIRIGIVAGHWGNGIDLGAVCENNNVAEVNINYSIATLVAQKLEALGYTVDLLQEFDPRLTGYHAAALVSIHNDTCADLGPDATGYKVAAAMGSRDPNLSNRLVACLQDRYGRDTGLPLHPSSITTDMTEYHAFSEVDPSTTAAIIETGFLFLDYPFLTQHTDLVAQGVADGIVCFVNNESVEPTPTP